MKKTINDEQNQTNIWRGALRIFFVLTKVVGNGKKSLGTTNLIIKSFHFRLIKHLIGN